MSQKISFLFQPYRFEDGLHVIEKDAGALGKRRYVRGISSGPDIDGAGERVTPNCVQSFHDQAAQGDILLYPSPHKVNDHSDLGLLTKSEILPTGDWLTEYRLYDKGDGMGESTLEQVNKFWKKLNGLPPYTEKKQYGFSIEGYIPEGGIIEMSEDGRRVVDKIDLDGVVVVSRPAYQASMAQAIYKALDEVFPPNMLSEKIKSEKLSQTFFSNRYQLQSAFEEHIDQIMVDPKIENKKISLGSLFDEYKKMMIDLILENKDSFEPVIADQGKTEILKSLFSNLVNLTEKLKTR